MDVTSVTSPIGFWTAARKPIVSNLGSAILKISGACWEKKNTDSTYMGMRRGHGRKCGRDNRRDGEVYEPMAVRAGSLYSSLIEIHSTQHACIYLDVYAAYPTHRNPHTENGGKITIRGKLVNFTAKC